LSASRRSGRLRRGRPRPTRGTRMASKTVSSCLLSWRWPAVSTTDSGLPRPSQEGCILVPNPPRLRPSASSCGWKAPFSRRLCSAAAERPPRAGALGPRCYPRLRPPTPPRLPRRTSSARGPRAGPTSRRAASARSAVVARLPRPVAFGQVAPEGSGPYLPQDAVYDRAVVPPLLAAPTILGQKRHDLLPHFVRKLAPSDHPQAPPTVAAIFRRREASIGTPIHRTRPSFPVLA
jgi:hypothetical protein